MWVRRVPPQALVGDGSAVKLDLVHDLVVGGGDRVPRASHSNADVAAVKRLRPGVIILDLIFGSEYLGRPRLRWPKSAGGTIAPPIVVCTGAPRAAHALAGHRTDKGIAIVPKPFDTYELLRGVAEAAPRSERPDPPFAHGDIARGNDRHDAAVEVRIDRGSPGQAGAVSGGDQGAAPS